MQYTLLIILIISLFAIKSFKKDTTGIEVLSNGKPITIDYISTKLIISFNFFVFDYWSILRGQLNTETN